MIVIKVVIGGFSGDRIGSFPTKVMNESLQFPTKVKVLFEEDVLHMHVIVILIS